MLQIEEFGRYSCSHRNRRWPQSVASANGIGWFRIWKALKGAENFVVIDSRSAQYIGACGRSRCQQLKVADSDGYGGGGC